MTQSQVKRQRAEKSRLIRFMIDNFAWQPDPNDPDDLIWHDAKVQEVAERLRHEWISLGKEKT